MAINKDKTGKCIFDPKNPRDNENYEILLDIIQSEEDDYYSLFTSEFFLQLISTTEIFQKDFKKILKKMLPKEIPQKSLENKINKKISKYVEDIKRKYSFLTKTSAIIKYGTIFDIEKKELDYFLKNIKKEDNNIKQLRRREFYDKSYIIFSNCIELSSTCNWISESIFITLEENKDEFEKQNLNDNLLYPIYLKKMEDLEVLLETLEKDLKKIKEIASHKFGYLGAIKIKNYFSIKDIEITHLKDKKEIYFVGGNGDGKTILLQAIVLGLKKEYSGQIIEYIRDEKEKDFFIKDEFSNDYSDDKNIKNVFAYGINRNKVREEFDKYGYSGIFDTSDFKDTTFLKKPLDVLKSDNGLIEEFIEKLNKHIFKDKIEIKKDGNQITFYDKYNSSVQFKEFSEGYKSTLIWLCDLVSRLIENQEDEDEKVTKLKYFKAIVLIDEVDLYLHPTWKYNFVYNLRMIFPKIQFIMITHSTATILGASKKAVFYKVYKENGETKISQPMSSIKNLMANNLSTSPLFDMTTARARNSDENLKTDDDFIYTKIHEIIAKRVKGKKAIVEDEIVEMINQELDDFLKENGL